MSSKSRLSIIVAGVVALVLAVDTAAWWFVTDRMQVEVAAWRQARIAEGAVVALGTPQRSGWPFEAVLTLPTVTLATDTPGQADAIAWRSEQVHLVYAPWQPETLNLMVDGSQALRFGEAAPVAVSVGQLDAHIPLNLAGQAQGIVVAARELSVPTPRGSIRLGSVSVRLRQTDAFVSATDATLPGWSLPFGGTIASLDFHARASGPIPDLRDLSAALTAWRDHGQTLAIDDLALHWGPLDVRGHASLRLDAAMQPEGSAAVQLTGFTEVLEALARSGAITRNDERVASTLLSLMARPGASDVAEADLPLTLKDRTLSVGMIPLLRVPPVFLP